MKPRNSLLRLSFVACILITFCLVTYHFSLEQQGSDKGKIDNESVTRNRSQLNEELPSRQKLSPAIGLTSYSESLDNRLTRHIEISESTSSQPFPLRKEQIVSELPNGGSVIKSESSYVASHILIGLEGDEVPEELTKLGEVVPLYPESGLGHYLLTIDEWNIDSVPETLALLAEEPYASLLRFAEPDWLVSSMVLPNDPEVQNGNQWALQTQSSCADLNANAGWEIRSNAEDVVVAIIDSGINITHQDLAGNLWVNPDEIAANGLDDDGNGIVDDVFGYNALTEDGNVSDDNGHGTHVAGIIGAVGNNGVGTSGVAWSTNLMAVKVMNENGEGVVSNITQGVIYAVNEGAHIINASFGSYNFQTPIYDVFHYAEEHNVLVAAAAGNDSSNNDEHPTYPSSYRWDNIVSVASLDQSGELSGFSNFGKNSVDIAAPGGDILSTFIPGNDSYDRLSGTSMAAPQIAGVLALLVQQFPGEPYIRYIDRLILGGSELDTVRGKLGYAIVADLEKSLSIINPPDSLRFTDRLDNSIVRFPGQSMQVEVEVEDETDVLFSWNKNGTPIPNATTNKLDLSGLTTGSKGTYSVVASKQGLQISDSINLQMVAPNLGLTSAADSNLSLGIVGNHPWSQTAEASVVGSTSIFSAPINNNSSSSVFSYIEGLGQLTFHWKVTSEPDFDQLQLLVNGEVIRSISGDTGWQTVNIRFADLSLRILEWRYFKDGTVSKGLDRGYLDSIQWISGAGDFPYIGKQPEPATVSPGDSVVLLVEAEGGDLNYQWFKDGLELPTANQSSLTIATAVEGDTGVYHVEVYNQFGSVRSDPVEVKVGIFPVRIIHQPSGSNVVEGLPAQFSVSVSGTPPFQVQWFKDDQPITGATESIFEIENAEIGDSGSYHAVISNTATPEGVNSETAVLNVQKRQLGPTIIKQSPSLSVPEGQSVELFVQAAGTGPLAYQWFFSGSELAGENSPSLIVSSVSAQNSGNYHFVVSNRVGQVMSAFMFVALRGNPGEGIDQPLLNWDTNNEANLKQITGPSHDGVDAMALFAEPENSLTWVSTRIAGPAEVSFWYDMDGVETPVSGRLYLSLDGELFKDLENPQDFSFYTFLLEEPGVHELRFTYVSKSLPLHAYLDELLVTPVTLIRNQASETILPLGENYSIELDIVSREPYLLEWFKDGQLLPEKTFPLLTLDNIEENDSGIYQAKITNEIHEVSSAEFELIVASVSVGDALEVPDLNFDFLVGSPWFPQAEEKIRGDSALVAPEAELSRLRTIVKGPVAGRFFSRNLNFSASSPSGFQETVEDNGWTQTTFHLPHPKYYELIWTSRGESPAYLDFFELYPLFYIKNNPNNWKLSSASELAKLQVEVVGSGDTRYQWFRDDLPIPGATQKVFWVNYGDVEIEHFYYVEVSRGGVVLKSRTVSVSRLELPEDSTYFVHEGLTFFTQGGGWWKVSELEPTASGGLSLSPGIVLDKDYYNYSSRLLFEVPGPGELSFRVKMNDPNGELNLKDSNSENNRDSYFYYKDEWETFTHRIRSSHTHTMRFDYSTFPPYDYDEVPVYIDNLKFVPAPVSEEKLDDLYATAGSNLRRRAFPITEESYTIKWFKDGQLLSDFSGATEMRIDNLQEEDEGRYSVRISESSGATSVEEFEVNLIQPLVGVLDSNVEQWKVSNPVDWVVEAMDDANGKQALVSSFDRYSEREILQNLRDPEIWLEPIIGGPGVLTFRYKFSVDADYSRLEVVLDENYDRYTGRDYSSEWIEETVVISDADFERIRLVFKVDPGFVNTPRQVILDSVNFEPQIFLESLPGTRIANLGDRLEHEVKSIVLNGATTTYNWLKDGNSIYASNEGRLVIPSLTEEHFGDYFLQLESNLGAENEYPFQIIDASIINKGMKQSDLIFRGSGHRPIRFSLKDDGDRKETLYLSGQAEFYWMEFETSIEGPFILRFDTKRDLAGDASIGCKFYVDGERVQEFYNDDWSTYEYVQNKEGTFQLRWVVDANQANLPVGWHFDNLEIIRDPVVSRQPSGKVLLSGSPFVLSTSIVPGKNGRLQWYQNGQPVAGAYRDYLPVLDSSYGGNGEYYLQIDNDYGMVQSETVEVVFQDNLPSEFPLQTWNRSIQNREHIGFSLNGGVDGGPAIQFNPSLNSEVSPSLNFTLLGPRKIEFLAAVPDSKANTFTFTPNSVNPAHWLSLSGNWIRQQIRLETLEPFKVFLAFDSHKPLGEDEFDTSRGSIDKVQVSWIEGHPFTRWLKRHYPLNYQSLTDLEILFGDDDDDGVYNFLEFATMSSPTIPGSNVWIERNRTEGVEIWVPGPLGQQKITKYDNEVTLLFFEPMIPDSPGFSYGLEYSPDFVNWTRIPVESDKGYILNDSQLTRIWPVKGSYDETETAFFRLIVSTEIYNMLNL
jgi:subtilisin family serine protease